MDMARPKGILMNQRLLMFPLTPFLRPHSGSQRSWAGRLTSGKLAAISHSHNENFKISDPRFPL